MKLLALLFSFCLSQSAFALTARVETTNGVPRIIVDGKAVRGRMFWGAPGSTPLKIGAAREESFEFVASESAANGTMHFRFGQTPGEIVLDDIRVFDSTDNREILSNAFENGPDSFSKQWNIWPPPTQNTVGTVEVVPATGHEKSAGLRIQLKAPNDGNWPDFHLYHNADLPLIENHRYRVSFWAQATPARDLTVAFYRPGTNYTHLGGPKGAYQNQIQLAAQANINFVSFPVALPWPEPGHNADWGSVDTACRQVLRANPKALLIPRIPMDPPAWWCKANPDEVMQWEDGGHGNYAVPASPLYRREAATRLTALIEHLEATFGDHVAGYHPGGQNTAEWFYEGTWKKPLNGYAPADLTAWRAWLNERYVSDAALQMGWHKLYISRATAPVPTAQERHAANGILRNPQTEQHLIDWAQFQQEAMADCVLELARAARLASRGRKLVLFFYGYSFEFGPVQNGPATSGHYALRRVLNSPDIDIICSPISYFDRALGGSAPTMTPAESIALAGKLYLREDDTHTYLASGDQPGSADHVTTIEETNAELSRNVAQEATRNFASWWMDLGFTGWFNDARMWDALKRLNAIDEAFLQNPIPFQPEVAAIIDERAMWRVSPGGNAVTGPGIYEARRALGRMGAPYGQYLLDDVLAGRVKAKLYVFLNAWNLSNNERARLAKTLGDATIIWRSTDAPPLTSESLRSAAKQAGVHLFTQSDCNVYANGNFLALHGAQDGPIEVNTGQKYIVFDIMRNEKIASGPKFTLPLKKGETRVLKLIKE